MEDDVEVVHDRRRDFGEEVVRIRVLRVPKSEKFPDGVKYAFHYGQKEDDDPSFDTIIITATTNATPAPPRRRSTFQTSKPYCGDSSANFPTTFPHNP